MKILTIGTFDLLHWGHIKLLKRCDELAGRDGDVVVGLNTDQFIKEYKKRPPALSYVDREKMLWDAGWLSVYPNNSQDAKPLILDVLPDLIVIGSDWMRKDYMAQLQISPDFLDFYDISLCYVPYTWDISSTKLKEAKCIGQS